MREVACRVISSICCPTFLPTRSTFLGSLGVSFAAGSIDDSEFVLFSAEVAALSF
jgi:hypothetical protein